MSCAGLRWMTLNVCSSNVWIIGAELLSFFVFGVLYLIVCAGLVLCPKKSKKLYIATKISIMIYLMKSSKQKTKHKKQKQSHKREELCLFVGNEEREGSDCVGLIRVLDSFVLHSRQSPNTT